METAEKILAGLQVVRAGMRWLDALGVERRRTNAIIERADAEGRQPTIEEAREELAHLNRTLDELEGQIDQRRGEE